MMQTETVPFALSKTNMQTGEIVLNQVPTQAARIDPTAWVDDHGDFLFRYAVARLRDDSIAEDVVQETLLSAIQSMGSYSGKASERTWLTSILKHKIIDHFRRSVREIPIYESETDL
jgi:RNA polymerase sigma-70 factor (ECF subfamily)